MLPRDRGLFQRLADVFCGHHSHAGAAHVGKDHLTGAAASRGAGGKVVTSEELASFRIFNPTATDEEIRTWIEKNRN